MNKEVTIAQIGNGLLEIQQINFLSREALFDYDLLIVDLNSIPCIYKQSFAWYKQPAIQLEQNDVFFESRRIDIEKHIDAGKPIIVFTPIPQEIQFYRSDYYNSVNDLLPISFTTIHSEGKKIEIIKNTAFTNFFEKYKSSFHYLAYFDEFLGTPLMKINGTNNIISMYYDKIIFLPPIQTHVNPLQHRQMVMEIYEILMHDTEIKRSLPAWSDKYFLFDEERLVSSLTKLEEEKCIIEAKLKIENQNLDILRNKKTLFTGTGNELEDEVKKILQEMGFEILQTEANRDDLIVKHNDRIAVIEIKGVSGSAAEKNAAQLEKWVMNYYSNNEIQPKAILLINSFKDTELISRTQETWPHQMLAFSTKREHCLLTTLQLLGIYFEILKNPSKKEDLVNSLFMTVGVYKGFEEWKEFLKIGSES